MLSYWLPRARHECPWRKRNIERNEDKRKGKQNKRDSQEMWQTLQKKGKHLHIHSKGAPLSTEGTYVQVRGSITKYPPEADAAVLVCGTGSIVTCYFTCQFWYLAALPAVSFRFPLLTVRTIEEGESGKTKQIWHASSTPVKRDLFQGRNGSKVEVHSSTYCPAAALV